MTQLERLAIDAVRHVEGLDEQIVELTGDHAEERIDSDRISGAGSYYLAHGSVWDGSAYAVRGEPCALNETSPGSCRKCLRACLLMADELTGILVRARDLATRDEEAATKLVAE